MRITRSQQKASIRSATGMNSIAAVCCFFNPAGFRRPRLNYDTFAKAWKRSGIPLYTVEVLMPGQVPNIIGERVGQVKVRAPFFHKESAINYGVRELVPREVSKIVWVDADLVWENYDWPRRLGKLLDSQPVVQLWQKLRDRNVAGGQIGERHSFAWQARRGSPGGAWAAQRELFTHFGGLFDDWPTGGNDSLAAAAFSGDAGQSIVRHCQEQMHHDLVARFETWAAPITRWVRGDIGLLAETVDHLYHGERISRQYGHRHKLLKNVVFDRDLRRDENGFMEWTFPQPDKNAAFQEFFENRKEDL